MEQAGYVYDAHLSISSLVRFCYFLWCLWATIIMLHDMGFTLFAAGHVAGCIHAWKRLHRQGRLHHCYYSHMGKYLHVSVISVPWKLAVISCFGSWGFLVQRCTDGLCGRIFCHVIMHACRRVPDVGTRDAGIWRVDWRLDSCTGQTVELSNLKLFLSFKTLKLVAPRHTLVIIITSG
jgi:hypothetical protein